MWLRGREGGRREDGERMKKNCRRRGDDDRGRARTVPELPGINHTTTREKKILNKRERKALKNMETFYEIE